MLKPDQLEKLSREIVEAECPEEIDSFELALPLFLEQLSKTGKIEGTKANAGDFGFLAEAKVALECVGIIVGLYKAGKDLPLFKGKSEDQQLADIEKELVAAGVKKTRARGLAKKIAEKLSATSKK